MRITERQLRKVIRSVISESNLSEMEDPAVHSAMGAEGHADSAHYLASNEDKIILELKLRYLLQKGREYLTKNPGQANRDMENYSRDRDNNMFGASSFFLGLENIEEHKLSVADMHMQKIFSNIHQGEEMQKALDQLKK